MSMTGTGGYILTATCVTDPEDPPPPLTGNPTFDPTTLLPAFTHHTASEGVEPPPLLPSPHNAALHSPPAMQLLRYTFHSTLYVLAVAA